ncbi:MAG: alpha/beta hydrolase [Gemmatimonadota bacterium]
MPSWQARIVAQYIRTVVRRRDWGEGSVLARRARRHFGTPRVFQGLALRGVRQQAVATASGVRGEWLTPEPMGSESASAPTGGVLLYVHGGGFVSCSARTHRPVTAALARAIGCRVFSADYRLAPGARFPAAFDDVIASYRWLQQEGAPGAPIAIAGESAGGSLVLGLAQHIRDAGWQPPVCVVALSPWTDLAGTGESVYANDGRCAMFRPENMGAFARTYLGDVPADTPRASPLYGAWNALPPVLLHVGSTELLLDDARRVHDRITAAGGSSTLRVYDSMMHGWHLLTPFVPEARAAVGDVAAFVCAHLSLGRE